MSDAVARTASRHRPGIVIGPARVLRMERPRASPTAACIAPASVEAEVERFQRGLRGGEGADPRAPGAHPPSSWARGGADLRAAAPHARGRRPGGGHDRLHPGEPPDGGARLRVARAGVGGAVVAHRPPDGPGQAQRPGRRPGAGAAPPAWACPSPPSTPCSARSRVILVARDLTPSLAAQLDASARPGHGHRLGHAHVAQRHPRPLAEDPRGGQRWAAWPRRCATARRSSSTAAPAASSSAPARTEKHRYRELDFQMREWEQELLLLAHLESRTARRGAHRAARQHRPPRRGRPGPPSRRRGHRPLPHRVPGGRPQRHARRGGAVRRPTGGSWRPSRGSRC